MTGRDCHVAMLVSNPMAPDPRVEKEAAALARAGYQVTVIGWDREGGWPPEERRCGVHVRRIGVRSGYNRRLRQMGALPRFWAATFRLLWRGRFALVHCHDLDTLLPGVIWAWLKRRPAILDAHELYADMIQPFVPAWVTRAAVALEHALLRETSAVITVGERLADVYRRRCARVEVVGNYPSLAEGQDEQEQRREWRARLGIPMEALTLAYVGSLQADRLFRPLLDALSARPDVHWIVAGRGAQGEMLSARAAGLAGLHVLGFIEPERVMGVLAAADVVYYGLQPDNPNARYSTPNALFNAMAAGRPMLCTDTGELADIVRREQAGLVCDGTAKALGDAVDELRDPAWRQAMGERARVAARREYNWSQAETRILALYRDLLAG